MVKNEWQKVVNPANCKYTECYVQLWINFGKFPELMLGDSGRANGVAMKLNA